MSFDQEHEHYFFVDDDPRYLRCACGQYAQRARTTIGQPMIRLIDPPRPIFVTQQRVVADGCPQSSSDVDVTSVDADVDRRDRIGA